MFISSCPLKVFHLKKKIHKITEFLNTETSAWDTLETLIFPGTSQNIYTCVSLPPAYIFLCIILWMINIQM